MLFIIFINQSVITIMLYLILYLILTEYYGQFKLFSSIEGLKSIKR